MRTRFQQEARIAARIIHPNIVAVLDFGEDGSSSSLVMERLPGTTLRDEIMRGPLALPKVCLVMTEALAIRALATSLAAGGLPGDGPMADALNSTAAQQPGASRRASAQQAMSLARVLLSGGVITRGSTRRS